MCTVSLLTASLFRAVRKSLGTEYYVSSEDGLPTYDHSLISSSSGLISEKLYTSWICLFETDDTVDTIGIKASTPGFLVAVVYRLTNASNCFDPRDRVWGILGLPKEYQLGELKTDSAISLIDIYSRLARHLFSRARPSDIHW